VCPIIISSGGEKQVLLAASKDRRSIIDTTMGAATIVANGLGYLVGAGSLLLYTPIAIRITRQRSADGLTLSTWWLKVISYTCSDIYGYANGYNLSTYVETLVITIEAAVVLVLVAYFQMTLCHGIFYVPFATYLTLTVLAIAGFVPLSVISVGQAMSMVLNVGAILPQLRLNQQLKTSGDYSPITAALASGGCLIRLFTTITLNSADLLLLSGFGLALLTNMLLLGQILYYGTVVEGKTLAAVLTADWTSTGTESTIELGTGANLDDNNDDDENSTTDVLLVVRPPWTSP
jgi:mannose-P-dolichol utilization defect 1